MKVVRFNFLFKRDFPTFIFPFILFSFLFSFLLIIILVMMNLLFFLFFFFISISLCSGRELARLQPTSNCQNSTLYPSCGMNLSFNVTSPVHLKGNVGYLFSACTPSIKFDGALKRQVLLTGFDPCVDVASLNVTHSPDGIPFLGNIIITSHSSRCGEDQQHLFIDNLKPALHIMVHDSETSVFSGTWGVHYAPPVYVLDSAFFILPNLTPLIGVSMQEGAILMNAIASGERVEISIWGAGRASAAVRADILAFANEVGPLPGICMNHREISHAGDPGFDPCWDRIDKIICVNGFPEYLIFGYIPFSRIPNAITLPSFSRVSFIGTNYCTMEEIGPAICSLKKLQFAYFDSSTVKVASIAECWDQMPDLQVLTLFGNQMTTWLSSPFRSNSLVYYDISNNFIDSPMQPKCNQAKNLQILSIANNQLNGPMCDISGMRLSVLDANSNQLAFNRSLNYFSGITEMQYLDLSNNNFNGSLPQIGALSKLFYLSLRNNQFAGAVPSAYRNLQMLEQVDLSKNSLTGSVDLFSSLNSLTTLKLSNNKFGNYLYNEATKTNGPYSFINQAVGPALTYLDLSNNLITGMFFGIEYIWQYSNNLLQTVLLSHNSLKNLPIDLFSGKPFTRLDFSFNDFDSNTVLPDGSIPNSLISFDLSGNPNFFNPAGLPSWVALDSSKIILVQGKYNCQSLLSRSNPLLTVNFDPSYYSFLGCSCGPGTYGAPPNCRDIPISNDPTRPGPVISPLSPLSLLVTNGRRPNRTFSDDWYGDQRFLSGLDTEFSVNLADLRVDSTNQNIFYSKSSSNNGRNIRAIYIDLVLNLNVFKRSTEILTVLPSNVNLIGGQIETYSVVTLSEAIKFLNSMDQDILDQLASFAKDGKVGIRRVPVIGDYAKIQFTSRNQQSSHFLALYSATAECPSGFAFSEKLGVCTVILPVFTVSSGLRTGIYVASGFVSLLTILVTLLMIRHYNSLLVRASSRPFTFFLLSMVCFMSATASLYAIIPDYNDNQICYARVWCSCISLMAILAVLVAKSFRVSLIFGTRVLLQIRQITDYDVFLYVLGFLSTQFLMLGIFTGLSLSDQGISEITVSGERHSVSQCIARSGFDAWVGVQIAIFSLVMVAGAFVAYRTRSVPSAFNESTHILMCLQLLVIFLIILVPIDWALVNESPAASVVIQGGGQLVLALFILATNFGPKIYYIALGQASDKKLLFHHVGAQVSATGSESSKKERNSTSESNSQTNISSNKSSQQTELQSNKI